MDSLKGGRVGHELHFEQIEYKPFKLFVMSVLWRMGIASHEMFAGVKLGEHEEKLRVALLTDDALTPTDYAFRIHALLFGGSFVNDIMMQAAPIQGQRQPAFHAVIAGYLFILFTAPLGIVIQMQDKVFGYSGDLCVGVGDYREFPSIADFVKRQYEAEKIRQARRTSMP